MDFVTLKNGDTPTFLYVPTSVTEWEKQNSPTCSEVGIRGNKQTLGLFNRLLQKSIPFMVVSVSFLVLILSQYWINSSDIRSPDSSLWFRGGGHVEILQQNVLNDSYNFDMKSI